MSDEQEKKDWNEFINQTAPELTWEEWERIKYGHTEVGDYKASKPKDEAKHPWEEGYVKRDPIVREPHPWEPEDEFGYEEDSDYWRKMK